MSARPLDATLTPVSMSVAAKGRPLERLSPRRDEPAREHERRREGETPLSARPPDATSMLMSPGTIKACKLPTVRPSRILGINTPG